MCNYKLTVTIGKNSEIVDGGGWVTSMTWRKSTLLEAKDRAQVLALRDLLNGDKPAMAMELPDGRIVTGKTSSLLGACSACILNALKTLAGIPDDVLLLSPEIIRPLQHLKVEHLGNKNPRLHVNEALIALAVCAVSDPVASRAMEALNDLAGSEAHATVILARADENTLSKLKINLTCEPKYETHKLYHG